MNGRVLHYIRTPQIRRIFQGSKCLNKYELFKEFFGEPKDINRMDFLNNFFEDPKTSLHEDFFNFSER